MDNRQLWARMFVTAYGSAYTRLRLALRHGNLLAVRAKAAELGRIDLVEALAIAELIRVKEPERFDAAAVPWAGRLALERRDLRPLKLGHDVRALSELPGLGREGCWRWPIRIAPGRRQPAAGLRRSALSKAAAREAAARRPGRVNGV